MPLTDVVASTAKPREKKYKLNDGHGMYLFSKSTRFKRWYLKNRFEGKESTTALDDYSLLSLGKAHENVMRYTFLLRKVSVPMRKKKN
ncbi:Arm DNA-binding domain-containing protein [Pantoea deleyi]|uniref:Arm DNA-binding domain-containing protein n=1 Tax=Pantoea deleyi TaxID=470932 RepID=UPI0035D4E9F0